MKTRLQRGRFFASALLHGYLSVFHLDGIDDAVVKLDGQAHFVAINQAAADFYQRLGFDPQSMKGKSVWEVFPDFKGTLMERELRSVIQDHVQISYEFWICISARDVETAVSVFSSIGPSLVEDLGLPGN